MVPGGVIPDIEGEEGVYEGEFGLPEGEVADEPLPVRPDVVILEVFFEHGAEEGDFVLRQFVDMGHEGLAVVPVIS